MVIKNQLGTTLIELLVAIAIIGIMSGIFVAQISLTDSEELNLVTERVAADLKQIRNLATSRVINENNVYPAGGYGINFVDSDQMFGETAYYILYADSGVAGYQSADDVIISKYIFPNDDLTIYPKENEANNDFYFTFINEHETVTDLVNSPPDGYSMLIKFRAGGPINTIRISDPAADTYTWGNINISYNVQ